MTALEQVERMATLADRRLELGQSFDAMAALGSQLSPVALRTGLDAMRAAHRAFQAARELQSPEAIQSAEFALGFAVELIDAILLRATAGASTTLH